MFNQFKRYIALLLCAALLNACILPSSALLALKKQPIFKTKQTNPVAAPQGPKGPQGPKDPKGPQPAQANQRVEKKEKPTIEESWRKIINFEWKSLNKADAWNIGKSVVGTASALVVAYALFKSKPTSKDETPTGPSDDTPGDKPTTTIPQTLQDIIDNDAYGTEYTQKIKDLCNDNYMQQLEKKGLINLRNQLEKEIMQSSNPTEAVIKGLIDRRHKVLQKHLKAGKIEQKKKTESLHALAKKADKIQIQVKQQKGALCGIHALHNGNHVLEQFMQAQDADMPDLLKNSAALSKDIDTELNTDITDWTKSVGSKRNLESFERDTANRLNACLPLTDEEKEAQQGWFNSLLYFFKGRPLHEPTKEEANTSRLIASVFRKALEKDANKQEIVLWENSNAINLDSMISSLADAYHTNLTDKQKQDIDSFIKALDKEKLETEFNGKLKLNKDFSAQNLDTVELENLVAHLNKDYTSMRYEINARALDTFNAKDKTTNTYNLNGKISVINATTFIGADTSTEQDEILKVTIQDKTYLINNLRDSIEGYTIALIRHQMHTCNKFVHTFILRLGDVNKTMSYSTHWVSVTLVRFDNKNHYFVTDSMCNPNIMNDTTVLELITAIEQPDEKELIDRTSSSNTKVLCQSNDS